MILFLDFDGVLRRDSDPVGVFEPTLLARFDNTIRKLSDKDVDIIISSDWRISNELSSLKQLFSKDIQEKIKGCTPYVKQPCGSERYVEIKMFFKANKLQYPQWLAIDDREYYFPANVPLLLCDSKVGLDEETAKKLESKVVQIFEKTHYELNDKGCRSYYAHELPKEVVDSLLHPDIPTEASEFDHEY